MLSQALAQGAPQEVVDAMLQRYREALQRYLQALAQNPQQPGAPPPPGAKILGQQDLDTLLKAIEQLAQSGARAQAQQLLAVLQNLLENLHMSQSGGGAQGDKALNDALQGLGDLMGKQRALLDKTFRQLQGKGDPKDGGAKGMAGAQSKLHDQLNQILKGLGDSKRAVPKNLGDAGHSMSGAERDFGAGDLDSAGKDQKEVLDALRQGANELANALMKQSGQGKDAGGQDPLGRAANGPNYGEGVKVPDLSDLQRARNILRELRKRAAERGRPQEELDYIDRLLKQF
jgi:tetratricopeptide (TPR) repeat protein